MDAADIAFAGAVDQARMLADGELTAPDLLEIYLERISRLDSELRAYRVVLADSARQAARAAQERLDAGERLPLLGVPVAIKDDVDVAGEVTACGSGGHRPAVRTDAEVVRRLRAAGAVILGKTNVPELMIFPFTESLTYGATRNPWNIRRTPGGSSGGSAAAVAAGLAPLALGSDGAGSIRIPSSWCGLYGLKPQRDRISMEPHEAGWYGLAVYGPMARSVRDAARFLDATTSIPGSEGEFYAAAERGPGRLRIALSTKIPSLPAKVGAEEWKAVEQAGQLFLELGHEVVVRDPDYPLPALLANFFPRYLRGISDEADAQEHPELLEPRTRGMARLGSFFSDRRMAAVRAHEAAVSERIQSIFDDVDIVVTPATAQGPSRIGAYQHRGAVSTLSMVAGKVPYFPVWNLTGQPAAVVPWDIDADGLPIGIQLVGQPYDEATLLSLSAQIEDARPWAHRRPPVA